MVLNAHAGTKYGIPFPVLVRASFGVNGANIPAVLRALVACGWFGIQTWIGGQAIYSMLRIVWPAAGNARRQLDLLLRVLAAQHVRGLARHREHQEARRRQRSVHDGIGLLLLCWVTSKAGGIGPVLSAPSRFHSTAEFLRFFVPSLTGMVGFWATVALNIPDFTRYAKSQRAQMLGQSLGLPPAMTLFSFIGVAVTSASAVIFGEQIWDPVVLIGRFQQPSSLSSRLIAILIATLNTNVAANVVSPSNDFANLARATSRSALGGLITGVAGLLMMPWKLLAGTVLRIRMAGRLLGAARSHRRRHDRRLLHRPRQEPPYRRPLHSRRRIRVRERLQLPRHRGPRRGSRHGTRRLVVPPCVSSTITLGSSGSSSQGRSTRHSCTPPLPQWEPYPNSMSTVSSAALPGLGEQFAPLTKHEALVEANRCPRPCRPRSAQRR